MRRKQIYVNDWWFREARKQKEGFGVSWPQAVVIREKLLFGDFKATPKRKRGKTIYEVEF